MKNTKMLICGDLVLTQDHLKNVTIDPDILDMFNSSNLNIVNLESPVDADQCERIIKTGPHLKGSAAANKAILRSLNIKLVTLANNHILDYGEQGLLNTISFCSKNGISTVGAGSNLWESQQPYRTEIDGREISIINFAENEWASAGSDVAGAHPMDVIDNIRQIKEEKAFSEKVIVIIHGGHEYYNLPSPRMIKQYRYYAEAGADLIVGHHTHCISGYEIHNGVPIYYSLGNFLFTKSSPFESWYTGLILEVELDKQGKISARPIPVRVNEKDFALTLLRGDEKVKVMSSIEDLGKIIKSESLLAQEWSKFVDGKMNGFIRNFSISTFIGNRFLRSVFNKLKIYKLFNKKQRLALHLNLIRCEAHADLSKEVLSRTITK